MIELAVPTSTGEPAADLQPPAAPRHPQRKPALPALTGLRTLLALSILLFHFTPSGLQWQAHPWLTLYPLVNIGYVFVSFFFVISGFILAYNYADRGRLNAMDFWAARFSRLYPVYLLTMLVSISFLFTEWQARPHDQFFEGIIATPLLLQGFFPRLATFWMTVTWTLSCEVALYILFPWLMRLRWPRSLGVLTLMFFGFWAVGLIPHTLYVILNPDHLPHMADRYSGGLWIEFLKYTPFPYLCTFLAGLTLGQIHSAARLGVRGRMVMGCLGFAAAWFTIYHLVDHLPYVMIHGGLLTPIFAAIILGLSGPSMLASIFSVRPLVAVGASTYCLYLLHFNVFLLLHKYNVPQHLHVERFDPWVSYVLVVLLALAVRRWVEHPGQVLIKEWWRRYRVRHPAASR
jgi:peptidoglycan/LPS O-acetylase OafA/YrhL